MKFLYIIMDSTGRKTKIVAKTRKDAIKTFLEDTRMPDDFFKKHCKITNQGRI